MTPDPNLVPTPAPSVARPCSNPAPAVTAHNQETSRRIGTGSTDPFRINLVAATHPDMETTASSHTHTAATIPLEDEPALSPAEEPLVWAGPDSTPTGAGTTRGTTVASATGVCRETGPGRDGDAIC
jgi:hypothetical protein